MWALKLLGNGCSQLPCLVGGGIITAWDQPGACPLAGCPYVATLLSGRALIPACTAGRPALEAEQLQALVADVLTAILHLQVQLWSALCLHASA